MKTTHSQLRQGRTVVGITKNNTPPAGIQNDPPSANETVAKLRLKLRHRSLQELGEDGLVRWARDKHVVEKCPDLDAKDVEAGHY